MKKLLSTLILILFVYNTVGFIVIHPLILIYYKSLGLLEAEHSSKNRSVELIVLSKEDILSKKMKYERIGSKEFRLNGNLYDIVKEIKKDSYIFLYCINDHRENSLFSELCKQIDDNVANRKQRNNTHNIFKKSITEPVSYLTINETDNVQVTYNSHNEKKHSFVWKEVITPPPQTLISTI